MHINDFYDIAEGTLISSGSSLNCNSNCPVKIWSEEINLRSIDPSSSVKEKCVYTLHDTCGEWSAKDDGDDP